jgi:hypothetical protein
VGFEPTNGGFAGCYSCAGHRVLNWLGVLKSAVTGMFGQAWALVCTRLCICLGQIHVRWEIGNMNSEGNLQFA